MTIHGRVVNGVVVPDEPGKLPEGAAVRVDVVDETPTAHKQTGKEPRRGGIWKGRVKIADDFDELPDDIAAAFGVREP